MSLRRKLLMALGASALSAPLLLAQPPVRIRRVGVLALRRVAALETGPSGPFSQEMRELGYSEGKNLLIEWRFAEGELERLADLAAELASLKMELIVAPGTQAISALQKATRTTPIVMVSINDPVGSGFVASLARPRGNITGLSNLTGDFTSKHLEMLLGLVPSLSRVAVLMNPANPSHVTVLKNIQPAAQRAGLKILPVHASTQQEIESAFSRMSQQNAGAAIVLQDALFSERIRQLAALEAKHRLPAIYSRREYVEVGGLISYGDNFADSLRRAAVYVDKILKGAKPGELPVEQPTKLELFINARTAKALGLVIPQDLLLRADRLIE